MEQMMLEDFKPPYRYIIDSCSINAQKEDRNHRRSVYKSGVSQEVGRWGFQNPQKRVIISK